MVTLTPKHDKIQPLRMPGYLFSQILDTVENVRESNSPSVRRAVFFRPEVAEAFSDRIRELLDDDALVVASFPNEWWITKVAKVLTSETSAAANVASYVNDTEYRHFYFGYQDSTTQVKEEDIKFEPLSVALESRLADLSAFMKLSKGFWLNWS